MMMEGSRIEVRQGEFQGMDCISIAESTRIISRPASQPAGSTLDRTRIRQDYSEALLDHRSLTCRSHTQAHERNDDTHGLTSYARLIDDNTLYNACFVCKSRFLFSHDMKTPCIPGNGKMEKRKRKRRRREEEKKLEKSHGSAQPSQQVVRYAYLLSLPSSPYFVTFVRCSSRFVKFLSDSTHFCSVFPISVHFFPPPTPELAASFDWSFLFDRALEPDGLDRVWSFQRSRPRAAHALISSSAR